MENKSKRTREDEDRTKSRWGKEIEETDGESETGVAHLGKN